MVIRILAYGGSIISTPYSSTGYNKNAINNLKKIIRKYPEDKFIIVIGGGLLAKKLIEEECDKNTSDFDKDLIGIKATKINAKHTLHEIKKNIHGIFPEVLSKPQNITKFKERVFVCGGWKPGRSTDYVALKFAEKNSTNLIYKITNVKEILDVKPKEFDKNKKEKYSRIKNPTWNKIVNLVDDKWVPRLNTPIDPKAAKLGLKLSTTNKKGFIMFFGKKEDITKMFENKFKGIIIK